MDWRIVLVLVVASLVTIGFVVLGLLLRREKNRIAELRKNVERWKGEAAQAREHIRRLLDLKANEELGDDEALEKINDLLDGWNPGDDPSGNDRDSGSTG